MSITQPTVGDRVRVRPFFHVPGSPGHGFSMCSPHFYPGTITEIISTDGAGILVDLDPHSYHLRWEPRQAFTSREVHHVDCACGICTDHIACADPRVEIAVRDALIRELRGRLTAVRGLFGADWL